MSRKRKKGKRRSAAQRAATAKMLRHNKHKKHRRRGKSMAKRRKKSGGRRRSSGRRTHHRRRRSGFHGGGSGLSAVKQDIPRMLMAAVYGAAEAKAVKDDAFLLNKVPRPITALGYTGNIAGALYLASMFVKHPYVRLGASVVATIATYKLGKNGGAFQTSDKTSIGDDNFLEGDEQVIDEHVMGALEAEATEHTTQPGLKYDDVVREAGARV
jgi:hypothetical protein